MSATTPDTSLRRRIADEILAEHQDWHYLITQGPVRPATVAELAVYEQRRHDGNYADLDRMAAPGPLTVPPPGEVVAALSARAAPGQAAQDAPEPADGTETARLAEVEGGKTPDRFLALHDEQDKREQGPDGTSVIPAVAAQTQTFPAVSE